MADKMRRPIQVRRPRADVTPGPLSLGPAPPAANRDDDTDATARPTIEHAALMLGRLVFGGYFLYSGLHHFIDREMLTGYARSKGVLAPEAAVALSGALIVAGGVCILTGTRPKLGAALIATFLAGVTPRMHDFWNVDEPQQRMQELVNFSKNVALVGGTLLAAARPEPWPWSLNV